VTASDTSLANFVRILGKD